MAEFDPADRFAQAQVAMLATVGPSGVPHAVPVVFTVCDETIYTAVDAKAKSTQRLKRLTNIEANPQVTLLVDHYSEDWDQLWWVRADGVASVQHSGEPMATGYALLRRKYPQYQRIALNGPVITIDVRRWASWHA